MIVCEICGEDFEDCIHGDPAVCDICGLPWADCIHEEEDE